MKRCVFPLLAVALLATLACSTSAQTEPELGPLDGYTRSDLQLISQESKDAWSPRWTGPIEAATILAWLQENGYPELLRDFNEDGEIDELDTIELADILGNGPMRTETPVGTNDARLVIGLARYVADHYPGQFVLKIYDAGFPAEFEAEGEEFAPNAIPGIELRLMGEPTLEAYKHELETAEGVIVGLEESENANTYLAGRSFLYEETSAGHTPVDLAWAEEDRFRPGHQGRVLETVATQDDRLYVDYRMGFTPAEFMLALSPIEAPGFTSMHYSCPPDALAYHVTTNPTPHGSLRVEECVIREGAVDIYVWIVTNIDFLWDGCGVCVFAVANSGLHAVAESGPPMWTFTESPGGWHWSAPMLSCGFEPGQTAVFIAVVPGPTTDAWVPAIVAGCGSPMSPETPFAPVRTTGPIEFDTEDCPDIELRVDDHGCTTLRDGTLQFTVWPLAIENVGGQSITSNFSVVAFAPGYSGSAGTTITGPLLPFDSGEIIDLDPLVFEIPAVEAPDPACPITIRVVADSSFAIAECFEGNNAVEFDECCPEGPGDERGACCFLDTGACAVMSEADCVAGGGIFEGLGTDCASVTCEPEDGDCPDLIVEILHVTCSCDQIVGGQMAEYNGSATVRVTNIGTAPSPSITNGLVFSPGGATKNVPALNPGEYATFYFHYTGTPRTCEDLVISAFAHVDPADTVTECDDGNNTDAHEEDCH